MAEESCEAVVAGLVSHRLDQPRVVERRGRDSRDAGEGFLQRAREVQALGPLGHAHADEPVVVVMGDDRHQHQRHAPHASHDASDERVGGLQVEVERARLGPLDLLRDGAAIGCADSNVQKQVARASSELGHRPARQGVVLLAPQEDADAVAVHDGRHCLHQSLSDLVAGGHLRHGSRQLEQGTRLAMPPPSVVQRGSGVQDRSGVARVHGEHVALLGEEATGGRDGQETPVVACPRGDVRNQAPSVRLVVTLLEQRPRDRVGILVHEAPVMDVHAVVGPRPNGEQILRCAHGCRGPLGDPRERGIDVVERDQVARGRVHAVESLAHRDHLRLERGYELLGVGGAGRTVRVPGDRVLAVIAAVHGARGLLHARRRQAE